MTILCFQQTDYCLQNGILRGKKCLITNIIGLWQHVLRKKVASWKIGFNLQVLLLP